MPDMFWSVNQALLIALGDTFKIFAFTLIFAIPLGLLLSFGSMSRIKPLKYLINFIVWVFRGTPLMLQLFVVFFIPGLVFHTNIWGGGEEGRMLATIVAFSLNYACYFSVIFRGGIEGVPVGQQEAGEVLGMTKSQIFFKITLLQMIKRVVPPMSNEIITLVKDTSLVYSVSYIEMFALAKQIAAANTTVMPFFIAGVFYYIFNFVVAWVMEWFERKLDYYR